MCDFLKMGAINGNIWELMFMSDSGVCWVWGGELDYHL
jgi:hypothetical protein